VAALAPIIIKKKKVHAGHHGGAWKVAYADFVTAMMAFFLVMWLTSQSKPIKAAVAGYFRDPAGVFEQTQGGGNGILSGGKGMVETPKAAAETAAAVERQALERSVEHIRARLDSIPEFKTLRQQIEFSITGEGLRVDLVEAAGSSFFDSGSAVPRPETERILGVIAREIGALDNTVIIEGHTDSRAYTNSEKYTNWELSADRANAARRAMERQGLKPSQVQAVRGHADRELKIPNDPLDPRNRRVSVVVKSHAG
jgi:chemotaxis protein MotB